MASWRGVVATVGFALIGASTAYAEESQFAYVYTTDLLPKGAKEVEQWATWRHGRSQGDFDVLEGRTEVEYGVTDKFQAALYANYAWARTYHNNVDGTTAPPESFAEAFPGADDKFVDSKFVGVSLEGIYRVLSPYTDPVGLAIYLEPTVGKDLWEMETRLILQKNFLDDRLITSFNVTVGQEARRLPADPSAAPGDVEAAEHWDHETDVNFGFAASYRFVSNWSVGAEFLNEREFSSFAIKSDTRTNVAWYFGPTVHYGGKDFFVTATFLAQLKGAKDYANSGPDSFVVNGISNADDFEKYRLRIKAGIYF
ncbi:MAG TPA: DUF6662 family protein [Burkholderiales bacterium]|nr:DUF6662 family protein [Burkholderiales bacterium]